MARKYRGNQITFKIVGFTPATLPSARLAQYLLDLNGLLGSTSKIHFEKLGKGSASIIQWAEPAVLPVIRKRIFSAKTHDGEGVFEVVEAYEKLNNRLIQDNAAGTLRIGRDKMLDFPGSRLEERKVIGPITQEEYLDGQLVRIGGIDPTIPVHLREGDIFHHCTTTNVDVARRLAPYLYGQTIRVFGTAHWYRSSNGEWDLKHFRVESFKPLQDVDLIEAVERVRATPHNDWNDDISNKLNIRKGES